MNAPWQAGARVSELVDRIVESYHADTRTHHIDSTFLPSRTEVIRILNLLFELLYPGYFGRQQLTRNNISYHAGELVTQLTQALYEQVGFSLRCQANGSGDHADEFDARAEQMVYDFLGRVPHIREMLAGDVQASYDGDPAAKNLDEVIFAYPHILAVTTYRVAHELHELKVPLMPRIMTEYAHSLTGIDIHPGAKIGRNFFIDHGTGVVIGETTHIGDNVKLYQGVTLGALSFPKDERGRVIRGTKRHPTIEDGVTIYSNAVVLGGETVVGKGAVIGGSVFLTRSVPPGCTVSLKAPDLKYRNRDRGAGANAAGQLEPGPDPVDDQV